MIRFKDTDLFFNDSPDPGEEHCKCSRCHRLIEAGETVARTALGPKDLAAVNKITGKVESLANNPGLNGLSWEFRLCIDCNFKYLRKTTGQSIGLCTMALKKNPDSLHDQLEFIQRHGKMN